MTPPRLVPADIHAAAARLRCHPAAVHAVLVVETGGAGGFLADGRLRILFEAHIFARFTGGRFNADYPDISSPTWNRQLYRGGAAEYPRLERAAQLDNVAAYLAASWGLFQVMGFNHALCGFTTVHGFVAAMRTGERAHLDAFLAFCEATGCADELAREDWSGFARIYNGPGFAKNGYHTKLARAAAQARRTNTFGGDLVLAPAYGVAAAEDRPGVLRIGQRGTSIGIMQARLNRAGFGPLVEDGIFGRVTELAVERFQEAKGLVVDGIAGPRTLRALAQYA